MVLFMENKTVKHFRHTCGRKRRYATKAAAKEVRNKMREKTGEKFSQYYCPYCQGWHVGRRWGHWLKKEEQSDVQA